MSESEGVQMKIYVASSWRNPYQPEVVERLRSRGHNVYDFRNPPEQSGFAWSDIDSNWESWGVEEYIENLNHPLTRAGFREDMRHLNDADATVLVMPCGRSAHLEFGYAVAAKQKTVILLDARCEPELMYKMAGLVTPWLHDVVTFLGG